MHGDDHGERRVRPHAALNVVVFCAGSLLASCAETPAPPNRYYSVVMTPGDIGTLASALIEPSIRIHEWGPWRSVDEFMGGELPSWHESARVVSWPSREPVPGVWEFTGDGLVLTFAAEEPLAEGWYALQVNFQTISVPRGLQGDSDSVPQVGPDAIRYVDGDWVTSRFHVGPAPFVQLIGGISLPDDRHLGGGYFVLGGTPDVHLPAAVSSDGLLDVRVNGTPVHCVPDRRDELTPDYAWADWRCDSPIEAGRVEVRLTRPLAWQSESGRSVRYATENGRAEWSMQTGQSLRGWHLPDSLFAPERTGL